jgi:hypothetical protein
MLRPSVHHRRIRNADGKIVNQIVVTMPYLYDIVVDFAFFALRCTVFALSWFFTKNIKLTLEIGGAFYIISHIFRRKLYLRLEGEETAPGFQLA